MNVVHMPQDKPSMDFNQIVFRWPISGCHAVSAYRKTARSNPCRINENCFYRRVMLTIWDMPLVGARLSPAPAWPAHRRTAQVPYRASLGNLAFLREGFLYEPQIRYKLLNAFLCHSPHGTHTHHAVFSDRDFAANGRSPNLRGCKMCALLLQG